MAELPPLPDDATVSVVVPARDSAATLTAAIDAVLRQVLRPDEIVIAVGPSDDDTWERAGTLAEQHPGLVRVVANPSGRTPDALNAAIGASSGQVVARVDAHAVIPPGYLATAVAMLRETGAANVGGRQVPTAAGGFARAVAAAMRSPAGTGGAAYRSGVTAGPVDTVYLGVFRREALQAVGGFDTAFTRNQDAELNLRLTRAGYTVWLEPSLAVRYQPRASVPALARQFFQYGRWRRRTAQQHSGSLRARQLAAPALVVGLSGALAVSLIRRDPRPLVLASTGYLGAVGAAGVHAAETPGEAPATALALVTMHLAWGVGFLLGPPRTR
ncbi:MAG: glycosyltransferase family 2 protein [Nitriliruptoraceae bacterium]|nr:glycosyltransferase family 2 protein [Nitriliruptoraceae bacterium]